MKALFDFSRGCYTKAWKRRKSVLVETDRQRCAAMMSARRLGIAVTSQKVPDIGYLIKLKP